MAVNDTGNEDLVKYQRDPNVLIVDVREKSEISETGILPGAINIPLKEVGEALAKTPDEFNSLYGKEKPTTDATIVFSCRSGRRSTMATETALQLGYVNSLNYAGGWLGWEEYKKQNPN